MMYRAQGGAANPTDVFIPILIATAIATIVGLTALCIRQKIKMDRVIWGWLGAIAATVGAITYFFANLPADKVQLYSTFGANLILFSVIIAFILAGIRRKASRIRCIHRRSKRGIQDSSYDNPIPCGNTCGNRDVPRIRCT